FGGRIRWRRTAASILAVLCVDYEARSRRQLESTESTRRRRLRAAAAEADAALGTDDCLSGLVARGVGCGVGSASSRRPALSAGVAAEPILLDDRTSLQPLNGGDSGVSSGPTEVVVAGQVAQAAAKRSGRRRSSLRYSSRSGTNTSGLRRWCSFNYRSRTQRPRQTGLGEWIKHMALATGMARNTSQCNRAIDLHSARALVDSRRRASMPERQLNASLICGVRCAAAAQASAATPAASARQFNY
uniref:SCAN box domain-containing protein n=1 Tax=Macrostomum lignano TaxID=282301 RepID=A0A1I8FM42_9PLAT